MKLIKLNVLFFMFFLGIIQANAQSHNKAAYNCVYLKEYLESNKNVKNAVSCVDCYCKTCGDKQLEERKKREQQEKQANQKRAQEVENRKGEQLKTIEQQKKLIAQQQQKAKENEVILVAPTLVNNKAKIIPKEKSKVDFKKMPLWLPIKDKQSGLIGYKEKDDLGLAWKITPRFIEASLRYNSTFEAGSNYAIVNISKGNRIQGQCGEFFLHEQAIIDRNGNILLTSGKGNEFEFFEVKSIPFVLKLIESSAAHSCSHEIYSLKEARKVASISPNFNTSDGRKVIFVNNPKLYINNPNTRSLKENFIQAMKSIYSDKTFEFGQFYYEKSIGWDDPKYNEGAWTAYLMNENGDFKMVRGTGSIYLK